MKESEFVILMRENYETVYISELNTFTQPPYKRFTSKVDEAKRYGERADALAELLCLSDAYDGNYYIHELTEGDMDND